MIRIRRLSTIVSVAALLAIAPLANGRAGAVDVQPTGPVTFPVAEHDCNNAPLALRATSDPVPNAIRTVGIVSTAASGAVPRKIDWTPPATVAPPGGVAHEWSSSGTIDPADACPAKAATDIVTVELLFDPPGIAPVQLVLVLNPMAPALDVPTKWTVPLAIWPFHNDFISSSERIVDLPVRESSHAGAIARLSAATTAPFASASTSTDLRVDVAGIAPLMLGPGQSGTLRLPLVGTPRPGTLATKLGLYGPGLPSEQPVDLTIEARVHRGFLLLTVVIGVVLGWLVNDKLQPLATLDTAKLQGLRAAAELAQRAAAQPDPVVQQKVMAVSKALEGDLATVTTADAVATTVKARQDQAAAIESQAVADAAALRTALGQTRDIITPGAIPDAAIAALLSGSATALERITTMSQAGQVTDAARALKEMQDALPGAIAAALRPWLGLLHDALMRFGTWAPAAAEPEATRAALLARVQAAAALNDPAALVKACDGMARDLRALTRFQARDAMARVFRTTAANLDASGRTAAGAAVRARADEVLRPPQSDDPLLDLGTLAAQREAVELVLLILAPANNALRTALQNGDFPAAVAALPAMAAAAAPVAPAAARPIDRFPPAPPAAADFAAAHWIRLDLPPLLPLNQPARADVRWADGAAAPAGPTTWTVTPEAAVTPGAQDATSFQFTPTRTTRLTVTATLPAPIGNLTASAVAGDVVATPPYLRLAAQSRAIDWTIDAIAAVVTVGAGYVTFTGSWFGTAGDFFAVLAWGFFGQFGLARIKTLAQPIVNRALPTG